MPTLYEIPFNPALPEGGSLQDYDHVAFDLARMALRPDHLQPVHITPPAGHHFIKEVRERDAVHSVLPGVLAAGHNTIWAPNKGEARSTKLWTPGDEPLDVDNHPGLILDITPPPNELEVPEGTWVGVEVDEAALLEGRLSIVPPSRFRGAAFAGASVLEPWLRATTHS